MTGEKLSSSLIGQFVHPVGGDGVKRDLYFSQLQVSFYENT